MKRMGLASVVLAATFLTMADAASAAGGIKVCMPKREGNAILTPKHRKCKKSYKLTSLGVEGKSGALGPEGKAGPEAKAGIAGLSSSELETLKSLLPHIKYVASGVGGKPTVQFSGVNVQVVNGEGKTRTANGEGNLVIGYDESAGMQTGSHNLILGEMQEFSSFGGIDAGVGNAIRSPFDSIMGGHRNEATGELASVSGGEANIASGGHASVGGGYSNHASGEYSAVSGGDENTASGQFASVSGGNLNNGSGQEASVSGGYKNTASGLRSSIFGSKELTASGEYGAIP